MKQTWVTMKEAVTILKADGLKVNPNTLSRLANRGTIQTKDDPLDARVRLVDIEELRRLFASRRERLAGDQGEEEGEQ
jgi:hypothetical protein